MRCETSFFSLTLFKKHLKRYWPMWAVWLAVWTLAIPVTMWNRGSYTSYASRLADAEMVVDFLPVMSVCIGVFAPIVAVAVFFHLFRAPAANFIGALPMQREGVFFTAFLAGYIIIMAPLIAVSLFTFLVEWALGAVAVIPLLQWLGGCALSSFFWFSFATLCCVISGNMVAAVCFYGIFNGVVAGMAFLLQNLLAVFLYGFSEFGRRVWEGVAWLSPVYKQSLSDGTLARGLPTATRFEMLWVYAAVGFLMFLAALGLHHIRKAERAGDLIAFGPIRWIFRISVTVCGGLAFGTLLMVIIFSGSSSTALGAKLAGCCAVAAMVSWFVAEMLLQKSFKVFKGHWRGAAIAAVCFVVAICAVDMDWIGFSSRVPQPGQVRSARAEFGGDVSDIARDGIVYDGETVEELVALHQYLVDHRDQESGGGYCRVEIDYDLGLTTLRREYHMSFPEGGELDGLLQQAQAVGTPDFDIHRSAPADGSVYWNDGYRELTDRETARLWAAIQEDVTAGRYRAGEVNRLGVNVELAWNVSRDYREWATFYPTDGTTSVNAVIEELDLLRPNEAVDTELAGGGEIVY